MSTPACARTPTWSRTIWDDTVGKECRSIDYAADVKPWIGKRAAVAGVDLQGKPVPVVALQVGDKDAATKGFAKLAACAKGAGQKTFGYSVGDDYVLISDSTAHATTIAAAGQKAPLSQDAAYQKWTEASGGPGILNGYVSKHAGQLLKDPFAKELGAAGPNAGKQLDTALADFQGAGATLRFKDGGLELAVAGGGTKKVSAGNVGDHVAELPRDTAAVLALSVDHKKLAKGLDDSMSSLGFVSGMFGGSTDLNAEIEKETGLRLPGDLATLLGDSFSLSLGGDAPADLAKAQGLSDLPAGYLVRGDDAAVKDVVQSVEQHTGVQLSQLPATFATAKGKAVLATTPDYAKQLLAQGSLGSSQTFKDVVPHADESPFVFYASLDNAWSDSLAKAARSTGAKSDAEIAEDVKALKALGISTWSDGSTGHALVRITAK